MFNRNTLFTGILMGLLMPAVLFGMLYTIFNLLASRGLAGGAGFSPDFHERTLAILAIAINLVPMNSYRRRRWEEAMRGVVIATAVLAFVWVFRYGLKMF